MKQSGRPWVTDTTSNGVYPDKVIALGSIDIRANVAPDPVAYMSQDLANLIN